MASLSAPKQQTAMPHALVLSFPMQGHINPLMELCSKLAGSCGFAITFVLSEHDYARWKKRAEEEKKKKKNKEESRETTVKEEGEGGEMDAVHGDGGSNRSAETLGSTVQEGKKKGDEEEEGAGYGDAGRVRLIGVPDKLPSSRVRTGGAEFRDSYEAMVNMREGVELVLARMQQSTSAPFCSNRVTFVLADTFVDWAHLLARQFQLPLVSFFTSNAASALVFLHAPSLVAKGILPFRDENDDFVANEEVADIPGIPPLHPRDFPLCFTFGASHYRYQFVLRHNENFHHSSAVLINTFDELETKAITALRQHVSALPIGPLLLLCSQDVPVSKVNMNYWEEQTHCLKWLDTQKVSSVVYISFGSIATMSDLQMQQLALGLEASQQPFLWVIRSDSIEGSLTSNLPDGFLGRTKNQGLIISWAPQLSVLSHFAVGAFMTHCGWNSTMENLSIGGLPTICWPLVAEQRMNCRIFVDEWRTGIEIIKGEDGVVDKKEVERVLRALMQGKEGIEMRARAATLQGAARKALDKEGSSISNFKTFVDACTSNTLEIRKHVG